MMDDDVQAELEFLQARAVELRQELLGVESAIGHPINEGNVVAICEGVVEALRFSGNEALAKTYRSAFDRFRAANATVVANLDKGEVNKPALDDMNDAIEDFERAGSEASAWFDSLGKKGSA